MGCLIPMWIICILLSAIFASYKGQAGWGVIVGALFGPIGVIIACILPDARKKQARDSPPTPWPYGPVEDERFPPVKRETRPIKWPAEADPTDFLRDD